MQLNKLTIAQRMTFAFFLVLASIVGIAIYSLNKLAAIHSNLEEVVTQNNVQIRIGNEMAESIHVISLGTRNMVLIQGRTRKIPEKETLEKAEKSYAAARGELQNFAMSDDEKSLLAGIDSSFSIAMDIYRKAVPMLVNDDEEAPLVVLNQLKPAMQKVQTAIQTLSTYKKESTERRWEEAQAHYDASRVAMMLFSVLTVVVAVLAGWRVTLSITRQLGGEPSDAAQLAKRVSHGDLTVDVELRSGHPESLMAQLSAMQASLIEVVGGVRHGAESVASASAEIASGNNDLSARTEAQASALEETAASMEQLSSTVRRNADNARQASQLALKASSVAVKGGDVVTQVVATMRDINDSSRKINDIISVIDGIAFQTNILALNAAVEAARAGEQGRGFAVVASEVRALAGRSAAAAKEIKLLINASVDRVQQGTALVDAAGTTMSEVVDSIKCVTDIVAGISVASDEQALGVAHVGEAVSDMDRVTQQNAALVEQMTAAALSLKAQAQELVQTVAVFQLASTPDANSIRIHGSQAETARGEGFRTLRPLALT